MVEIVELHRNLGARRYLRRLPTVGKPWLQKRKFLILYDTLRVLSYCDKIMVIRKDVYKLAE
jgi:hypothetical protein